MSRPELKIDWQKVDELLGSGCLGTEIAGYFGMNPETFYDKVKKQYNVGFSEYMQEKRSKGDALLRHQQYCKAMGYTKKGDTQLLIRLGQDRLGQKDNKDDNDKSVIQFKVNYDGSSIKISPETLSTQNTQSPPVGG